MFAPRAQTVGPIAQSVEQRTFNPWVDGSSPSGPTLFIKSNEKAALQMRGMQRQLCVILAFVLALVTANPASAATQYFSSVSTGCSSTFPAASGVYSMRYKSNLTTVITAVNILVGTNITTGYESTTILFLSDSASANVPFRITDTFTPSSIVGSGATTVIRYIGTHSVVANEKFWIAPNAPVTLMAVCYKNISDASPLIMNGLAVDTSTSVTSAYRAFASLPLRNSTSWNGNPSGGYFQMSIEGDTPVTTSTISVALDSGLSVATYRSTVGSKLKATANVEGKVTFFHNGKKISGCIKIPTSNLIAYCDWKPSIHGVARIQASLQPTDGALSASISEDFRVSVVSRSTKR
jgi:hypothetical protein